MKKTLAFMLLFLIGIFIPVTTVFANNELNTEAETYNISVPSFNFNAKSVVLMEYETGEVIFANNENQSLPLASVTKIMTLLLVMEAIDEERITLDSDVSISEYASSMGGSQVFLKEGESMTVRDLIKCTVIASANDAAVALSEHLYGSETAFVSAMNEKARALGMLNTNFENTTGLDDTTINHVASAMDIAIMSRELLSHKLIREYSSLWQDSIRGGEFILTNTNRLVRYYDGCTGLKTGSTDKAGYCISASAERNGMQLIAVVMGANTRDERNNIARTMLDYGFSNYALFKNEEKELGDMRVLGSKCPYAELYTDSIVKLVNKGDKNRVRATLTIPEFVEAPKCSGDSVGSIAYTIDGRILEEKSVCLKSDIPRLKFLEIFFGILRSTFTGSFT